MNERKTRINRPLGRMGKDLQDISWEESYRAISDRIKEMEPTGKEVIALTDTHATNEELFLLKKLLKQRFLSDNVFCPLPKWEQIESKFFINTLITTDKSPNRAGALALQIKGDPENNEVKNTIDGELKVAIILGNPFEKEHEIQQKIKPAQLVVHIGAYHNCWSEIADVVLPGQYYSEKKVTFTNKLQQVQATDISVQALRRSRPEWQIIVELAHELGHKYSFNDINQVFEAMAEETKAFSGLNFDQIRDQEIKLKQTFKDNGMKLVQSSK